MERTTIAVAIAESYDEQEYKKKPMVIDVSGLEMFKELKPIDFTTKGFPQYATNNKANTISNVVYNFRKGRAYQF